MLLDTSFFSSLKRETPDAKPVSGTTRYVGYVLVMFIPILTYFWLQNFAHDTDPNVFPQNNHRYYVLGGG